MSCERGEKQKSLKRYSTLRKTPLPGLVQSALLQHAKGLDCPAQLPPTQRDGVENKVVDVLV